MALAGTCTGVDLRGQLPDDAARMAKKKPMDPRDVYEEVYGRLAAIMDDAPEGEEGVELAVLDAVISAAAHFCADSFSEADAAPGVLKCMQLFAERMRETLVDMTAPLE
jgi:hypothetical protein